jgi:hypothetical protein
MVDQSENFPKEKRRSPRVSGALVEYFISGDPGDPPPKKKAFIKDLCIHGICIYIPSPVKEAAELCMDVFLFGSDIPVTAKGKVVWQKLGGYFNFHNVGIEFTEISDDDRKTLEDHISANYKGSD